MRHKRSVFQVILMVIAFILFWPFFVIYYGIKAMSKYGFKYKKEVLHSDPVEVIKKLGISTLTPEQSASFDFEDANLKYIEKMIDKIDAEEEKATECDNPEDVIKHYNKAIKLAEEFKAFCYASGSGGKYYYDHEQLDREIQLREDLQSYINNDYAEAMREYQEAKEFQKHSNEVKEKVLNLIQLNGEYLQKDLYTHFSQDDKNLVIKHIDELVRIGKINKEKKGNTNRLTIVQ